MYKNYAFLPADHLPIFGGDRSDADFAGAFSLQVNDSWTFSDATIGSRLIMFGD